MIGRPKVPLVLTTPEQQALDSLAIGRAPRPRSLVERALSWRVRVVWDNQTVAKKLRWWAAGAPAL